MTKIRDRLEINKKKCVQLFEKYFKSNFNCIKLIRLMHFV